MFGIGLSHILLVAAIALIFIGPEELPQVIRLLAKTLGQLKRATDDLSSAWHSVSQESKDYFYNEKKEIRETVYRDAPSTQPKAATPPPQPEALATNSQTDRVGLNAEDPDQLSLNLGPSNESPKPEGHP